MIHIEKTRKQIGTLKQEVKTSAERLDKLNENIEGIDNLLVELMREVEKTKNPGCEYSNYPPHSELGILSLHSRKNAAFSNAEKLAIATDFIPYGFSNIEHLLGVGVISEYLFKKFTKCDANAATEFGFAAMLHDCGKVLPSTELLLQKTKYKDKEEELMRKHPENGFLFLQGSPSSLMSLAAEICLTHHERWNGSGYPRGLVGEKIPLSGQIVGIADIVDSISKPSFSKKESSTSKTHHEIKSILIAKKGVLFSPVLIDIMFNNYDEIMEFYNEVKVLTAKIITSFQQITKEFGEI